MGNEKMNSRKQEAIDTGMAFTLICLIGGLLTREQAWFMAATGFLVIDMTAPMLFRPAATVWFAFSRILGSVMSRLLLGIVFLAYSRLWRCSAAAWATTSCSSVAGKRAVPCSSPVITPIPRKKSNNLSRS